MNIFDFTGKVKEIIGGVLSQYEQDNTIWEPMTEEQALLILNNDFNLRFKFESYRKLNKDADMDNAVLNIFGKNYISCKCFKSSTEVEPLKVEIGNKDFEISYSKDIHGKRVVSLTAYMPIFDSDDSMYDRWHCLYLISDYHKSGNITGVYATGGWCGVAKLILLENMMAADSRIKELLEKHDFFLHKDKISLI